MYRTSYLMLLICCTIAVFTLASVPTLAANRPANVQHNVNPLSFPPTPDKVHGKTADALLQQIWDAQPGQPKFDAINAVVQKYNQSDAATKDAIAWLCLTYMYDTNRGVIDRWPCEYVLSYVRYEPAIQHLIYVLLNDKVECMRSVAAEALGMWYKSTGNAAILDALQQSAKTETSKWVQDTIAKYVDGSVVGPGSGVTLPPDPDESHRKTADALLQQIWDAQPGQPKFDAINAVAQKYNGSDTATRDAVAWLCLTYMYDTSRGVLDRWPCEYVLSYVRYEPAIQHLIYVLLNDKVECMRSVAAEALGMWYKSTGNATIRDALLQSAKTDTSSRVKETIARYVNASTSAQHSGSSN